MNTNIFVIVPAATIPTIDYSKILETSAETLRWNLAETAVVVNFQALPAPSFLDGLTQYTHAECLELMHGPDWTNPDPGP